MVAPGAFPIVKLGALAVRQVAKPLASWIKHRAKTSPFFRDYICMPPAQFYHWADVNIRMRMLNLGKPREVRKLDQNAAIELGADLLGETVIFGVAAVTLIAEYRRQSRNAAKAAADEEARWKEVEDRLAALELVTTEQLTEIKELNQKIFPKKPIKEVPILIRSRPEETATVNQPDKANTIPQNTKSSPQIVESRGAIGKAIDEATGKLTKQ